MLKTDEYNITTCVWGIVYEVQKPKIEQRDIN